MKSIEIDLDKKLHWPNCCAYCMSDAHALVKSKQSVISGINPFYYTRRFITIKHPVCKKHHLLGKFYGFLSHQSFVDLFVGLLFIPLLVFLPFMAMPFIAGRYHTPIFIFFCAVYVVSIATLKAKQPVKVNKRKKNGIGVSFANDSYAEAFRSLNG
jgi:hypothetical protein